MQLGKMLTIGLLGSSVIAKPVIKKSILDCSLLKVRHESDKWVKSQAEALATCSTGLFDKDECIEATLLPLLPERNVEACIAENSSLLSDPTLKKNVREARRLTQRTAEVFVKQVAKLGKQKKFDSAAAKNHSHIILNREL